MDRNVRITLHTTQMQEGETHELKFSHDGTYFQKGEHHYVLYEEPVENSVDVIKNRLKFSKQFLEVVKKGALNSTMYFEQGKNYLTQYHTPFGNISLQVDTHQYVMEWLDENEICLRIHYELSNEQGQIAGCKMEIRVKQ